MRFKQSSKLLVVATTMLGTIAGLFINTSPAPPAGFPYAALAKMTATGSCIQRPSAAGAPYYNAIIKNRQAGKPLPDAAVMYHVANRLGYGLSPVGPITLMRSNDCTTVFMGEEVARQLSTLGKNLESAHFKFLRDQLFPISRFTRNQVNVEMGKVRATPGGVDVQGAILWHLNDDTAIMHGLRASLGSQVVSGGVLYDHQMNLEDVLGEFWFNHFSVGKEKSKDFVHGSNGYAEELRLKMAGSFYQLLTTAIKHPAMIYWLDNGNNRFVCANLKCAASNQNLGREVMELHTFNVGPKKTATDATSPYTQADVEAMAQILAGYNLVNAQLPVVAGQTELVFNELLAARVPVTLMGVTYPYSKGRLDAVLKMLANHPSTKTGICGKLALNLYATSLRPAAITTCVAAWGADGDLAAIYKAMLSKTEFWSSDNYMMINKSPIEVVQSTVRALGLNIVDYKRMVDADLPDLTKFTLAALSANGGKTFQTNHSVNKGRKSQLIARRMVEAIRKMGLTRMNFPDPTGYPEDRREFISSLYIDNASRMAIEMSTQMYWLDENAGTWRQDAVSQTIVNNIWAKNPVLGATQDYYFFDVIGVGDSRRPASSVRRPSPYILPSSQAATLLGILADQNQYATYTNENGETFKIVERTFAAMALANSFQLKK